MALLSLGVVTALAATASAAAGWQPNAIEAGPLLVGPRAWSNLC